MRFFFFKKHVQTNVLRKIVEAYQQKQCFIAPVVCVINMQ